MYAFHTIPNSVYWLNFVGLSYGYRSMRFSYLRIVYMWIENIIENELHKRGERGFLKSGKMFFNLACL